jgi:hypothetical protein
MKLSVVAVVALVATVAVVIVFISTAIAVAKHRTRRPKVLRSGRGICVKTGNTAVAQMEYSDIKYYNDLREEYNKRLGWYDRILPTSVPITDDAGRDVGHEQGRGERPDDLVLPDEFLYHLDNQNVHDTMIQNNLKNKFSANGALFSGTEEGVISEILEATRDGDEEKQVARVLASIHKRNAYLDNFGTNEIGVLSRVWNNGDDNVKADVITQLKDCEDEYGLLYCPTGVASRITSSMYINDPQNSPKTRDMIHKEILDKYSTLHSQGIPKHQAIEQIIEDYNGIYSSDKILGLMEDWIDYV